jgi:phosphatidate cytidylyltransferase
MGAILIVVVIGILTIDSWLPPWYPFLLLILLAVETALCLELEALLGRARRLPAWFCCASVLALLVSNWPAFILHSVWHFTTDPWHWVLGTFVVVILSAFVVEMATFREPGESVTRVAITVWIAAYLGLLPCFLVQLRWPPVSPTAEPQEYRGTVAVLLAVFVPKVGDIGAYMTGRYLGRTKMTPLLSPKKTWEGFAGGLVAAVGTAILLYQFEPNLRTQPLAAVGFGVTVWIAAVLGDLAESLIKRDCRQKDASQSVPGFGGLLDVVDSVVFSAPVSYCWLRLEVFH